MEKVYIAVVNQNRAADVPHQDILGTDLACIVKVRRDDDLSSHVVTGKDLQTAKLTDEELFDLAYPSISPEHFYICPIEQVISGDNREELTADSTSGIPHHTIYVVSNEEGLDGASILANPAAMQHIQSRFGGSELMVIPSSVHEILIIRMEDIPDTKTGHDAGVRSLHLSQRALRILEKARELSGSHGYIFTSTSSEHLLYDCTFNKHLKKACLELNIQSRSAHKIRFWAASSMAANGADISTLMANGGWSDKSTALHYLRRVEVEQKTNQIWDKSFN